MKRSKMVHSILLSLFAGALVIGCADNTPSGPNGQNSEAQLLARSNALAEEIATLPMSEVSPEEQARLVFMREEEKVARDVYIAMYQRWGTRAFNNISRSEDTHMRAILMLLNRYSIPDPVGTNGVGVFSNAELQNLYDQLIARGNTSLEEALRVGVLIEETDIDDLEAGLAETDNLDIARVYTNLKNGSFNHLRAFNSLLGAAEVTH